MPRGGGATALFIDWIGVGGGVGPGFHGVGAGARGVGLRTVVTTIGLFRRTRLKRRTRTANEIKQLS